MQGITLGCSYRKPVAEILDSGAVTWNLGRVKASYELYPPCRCFPATPISEDRFISFCDIFVSFEQSKESLQLIRVW